MNPLENHPTPAGANDGARSKWSPLLLLLIIVLGFGLRLSGLAWGQGYAHFCQGDAIVAYDVAVDYGRGESRAAYIGQPNYNEHSKLPGPLYTVFCFFGLRFFGSVEGAMLLMILLNTAAIYFNYLLAERMFGNTAALWAALFTATFPWVIFYSGGLYNPDVMPALGALLGLALWQTVSHERARAVFWAPVILLALPQFHMSGLLLIPAVILLLALNPVRLNFRWLAGGILAGAVLYAPYVRGEMANGWANSHGMVSGAGGYSFEGFKALTSPLSFLVSWSPRWTRSVAEYREIGRACFGWFGFFLVVNLVSAGFAVFLLGGAFFEIRKAMRGFWRSPRAAFARSPGILFCAVLFLVPLCVAIIGGKPFHTRYCLVLLPPMLVLAGVAAKACLAAPRARRIFLPLLVVTTCANVWFMPAMYAHQGRRIERGEIFIPSFRKLETVYQHLRSHAGPNRAVHVMDAAYLAGLPPGDEYRHDARMIREYVEVREKETRGLREQQGAVMEYQLVAADQIKPDDGRVAYCDHGIALQAVAK